MLTIFPSVLKTLFSTDLFVILQETQSTELGRKRAGWHASRFAEAPFARDPTAEQFPASALLEGKQRQFCTTPAPLGLPRLPSSQPRSGIRADRDGRSISGLETRHATPRTSRCSQSSPQRVRELLRKWELLKKIIDRQTFGSNLFKEFRSFRTRHKFFMRLQNHRSR